MTEGKAFSLTPMINPLLILGKFPRHACLPHHGGQAWRGVAEMTEK
ncbi:hypothetical protein K9L63_02805 [Candidatus Gracilibacteria bacterium]|nr:hypothetical protein [Candidatus Gracilibacteria bacterium]